MDKQTYKEFNRHMRKFAHVRPINDIHDPLVAKLRFAEHIAAQAENGKVMIVSSGMDCDGCAWSSAFETMLPASVVAVEHYIERSQAWADGPINFGVLPPSERDNLETTHRDLGMEAFENGHPHVLRP